MAGTPFPGGADVSDLMSVLPDPPLPTETPLPVCKSTMGQGECEATRGIWIPEIFPAFHPAHVIARSRNARRCVRRRTRGRACAPAPVEHARVTARLRLQASRQRNQQTRSRALLGEANPLIRT